MFSTRYACSNCGSQIDIKKFFFNTAQKICPQCGSKNLVKATESSNNSCNCNSNKKSRFT
ncbi:zinc ribbon domain-containing protein [Desulfofarcimen acetoxidans]|uniref:zinc ribbon domain-containing protein n=1 Tax=Desulfofarcimen acetoxidans TaxID=58138 RepID=UPI0002FC1AB5|nr:zinc ribbon domain-containing protein [Desulfofarcimen acetoxidans]